MRSALLRSTIVIAVALTAGMMNSASAQTPELCRRANVAGSQGTLPATHLILRLLRHKSRREYRRSPQSHSHRRRHRLRERPLCRGRSGHGDAPEEQELWRAACTDGPRSDASRAPPAPWRAAAQLAITQKRKGAFRRPSPLSNFEASDQRLENWKRRRAPARPYFLRSTTRLSRVRKPLCFMALRRSGSYLASACGDAVAHRAGLARQAAARDGGDHVELVAALRDVERLLDDHLLGRAREVDLLVAAVDGDLAGAGLHPDAGDGVLAPARGIGAALRVDFLLAMGRGDLRAGRRSERPSSVRQRTKVRLPYQPILEFLGFIAATSSFSGCCASCSCVGPL